jgi:Calcineurin-like phosphoesterase
MRGRGFPPAALVLALLFVAVLSAAAPAAPAAAQVTGSVLLAAGDIGSCSDTTGSTATAKLVGSSRGIVAPLGDANGRDVSLAQYQQCYGPTWGQYLSRTRPAAGNRDLEQAGPTGYYDYFGGAAGPRGKGYYSYTLGTWHVVVLNSSCAVAGCATGSAQGKWLSADLAAHPGTCTLAYWHRPLFTSGSKNPGATSMRQLFTILYDHHADVVLSAHNEQYERFAPQNPDGVADPNGIREFVVGSGGLGHEGFGTIAANSEVRNADTFGILKLTLGTGAYSWQFLPVAGQAFTDSGTGTCHSAQPQSATLLAAGDIPTCRNGSPNPNAAATAALIGANSGSVAVLGDGNNDKGTLADYNNCFGPTWGQYKSRIRPTPGNHDYMTAGAAGYFAYWGAQAGPAGHGYYSYDLGTWHIVVLNANCSQVPGGCGAGSPQEAWLKADLAAHPAPCTLAYWHQPLFTSSAVHPGTTEVRPLWQDLYNAGAEIVLNGHNHQYERFAPQTPTGAADPATGIREFVVGTGGTSHYAFGSTAANSQVRNNTTYGVLKLTLDAGSYRWQFLPVAGQTFTDSGTGTCH